MPEIGTLFLENDGSIVLTGLIDDVGSYINDAVVTLTISDVKTNEEIVIDVEMTLVSGSPPTGNYSYSIDDALAFILNRQYLAKAKAESGGDTSTYWMYFRAIERIVG